MSTQNLLHRDLECHTAPPSPHKFPLRPVLAGSMLVIGFILWSQLNKPTVPVTLIAGLDSSRSVRRPLPGGGNLLARSRALLADMAPRLASNLDRVKVVRVDREAHEFFDAAAPAGTEAFLSTLIDNTETPPAQDGTHTARFWSLTARQAASVEVTPGAAIGIAFLGDGDNDDLSPQAQAEIEQAARTLAVNRRVVAVEFFGANPKNWATLRALFAPLGSRLRFHPPQEMNADNLLARLNAARLNAVRFDPAAQTPSKGGGMH